MKGSNTAHCSSERLGGIRSPAHGCSHTSLAPFAASTALDIISFLFIIGYMTVIIDILREPGGSGDSDCGRRNASLPALVAGRLSLGLCTRPPGREASVHWPPERPLLAP